MEDDMQVGDDATTTATSRERINTGWLFGGEVPAPGPGGRLYADKAAAYSAPDLDVADWQEVRLPHTVVPLSWKLWNPSTWEKVWVYRRPLRVEQGPGRRSFLDFDAVLTNAVVALDGQVIAEHVGGYLPFSVEITELVADGVEHQLAVVVDSRAALNVPPNPPAPIPAGVIDFWQPGGIHRDVWLRDAPASYVRALRVSHHDVLDPARRRSIVEVEVDSATTCNALDVVVTVTSADGAEVGRATQHVDVVEQGITRLSVEVGALDDVRLWDIDDPVLYDLTVTLEVDGRPVHRDSRRTGYREARFEPGGFFLNGRRRYLMGVNRHGLFPYKAFSMPDRVERRDAEIIKRDLNCAMVRCSHYPQSPAFLDACDELGLLVWEESPGWQFVGDQVWQDHAADDIANMIERDRHRPSIVVWGARLNETPDNPEFYDRTERLVKALDPTRQTSGTMHGDYMDVAVFQHDVFSYDDYATVVDDEGRRRPRLRPPVDGRPYLVSEAVSIRSSPTIKYRRAEVASVQQHQALDYAQVHDDAMGDPRFSGLLAWVAFDYQSARGDNHHHGTKTSGLGDVFRVLKPGAAIYQAQVSPTERIVVQPAFTWDPPELSPSETYATRPEARAWGPGAEAMICSNCDYLDVFLGNHLVERVHPDRARFPHLPFAPSFVDLTLRDRPSTDLRIDGYLGDEKVLTRRYSGDRSGDTLAMIPDDRSLFADGVDATRVVVMIVDRFGEPRGASRRVIQFNVDGPGLLIGDSSLNLEDTGAVGAVWVQTIPAAGGTILVSAVNPELGRTTARIESRAS
ncbi:glycoside hydrolase family 2 protein [Humibacter sp.]|jgi:beta-galactosidase|uniref:glycoside hydrolase family 2 protein n=1 Tax=Humibacter sp. TaxID=1940291 RepID=UPI002C7046FD|nr:glycoside hydrolase family 2 TIM barrel-domain containing protein [Humibacter sp.]HVX06721.1 glycoside hydrolase family 2 TIM barrel-domain containing protein [Humibacter sp.]